MDTLIRMSFSGGILILMILAVRIPTAGRLPRKYLMMLWGIALLRLLLPIELPMEIGITIPAEKAVTKVIEESRIRRDELTEMVVSGGPVRNGAADIFLEKLLPLLWALGALLLIIFFTALYIREYRRLREAIPLSGEQAHCLRATASISERTRLLVSDRIGTPFVFGIIRPKIILPAFLLTEKSGRLKFVLAHEAVHVRRRDNLWKIIMLLAACLHWFNPLVWVMYLLFNRDMELSCDEKVLSLFGEGAKKEYARALVALAEKQSRWQLFSYGFGKSAIRERIEAIMKFRKATALSTLCAVLLLGAAVTVFAQTDVQETRKEGNASEYTEETVAESGTDNAAEAGFEDLVNSDEFSEYEKFGLTYDSESKSLRYDGQVVGYFSDEAEGELSVRILEADESEEYVGIMVTRDADGKVNGLATVDMPTVNLDNGEVTVADGEVRAETEAGK